MPWQRTAAAAGLAVLAVLLAGCATAAPQAALDRQPADGPARIIAAAEDLLAGGPPQADGSMWTLAGPPASKGLFEFNMATGRGIGSVSVSAAARSVTESSNGVVALVLGTANSGAVQLFNGATGVRTQTVPIGAPGRAVAAGADGTTFYVLNGTGKSASVTIVNAQDGRVQGTVPVPVDTVSAVPDTQGTTVYALQPDGTVSQIAVAGGKIMTSFPAGAGARSVTLSPDGSTLYVLKNSAQAPNVAVVNLATQSVRSVLPAAAHCRQLLVSAQGNQLYQLVGAAGYGNIQTFAA